MNRSDLLPKKTTLRKILTVFRGNTLLRDCTGYALAGFAMAQIHIFDRPTAVAACLTAAPTGTGQSIAAALGAMLGYLLTGDAQAVQWIALTGLLFCAVSLFRPTPLGTKRLFMPLTAAVTAALLGSVPLWSFGVTMQEAALLAAQSLLAGVSADRLRAAREGSRRARLFAAACLTAGAAGLTLPIDVGLFCAAALAAACDDLPEAVTAGAALDLCGGYGGWAACALSLPSLLCRGLPRSERVMRLAVRMTVPVCVALFLGHADLLLLPVYIAGTLTGAGLRGMLPVRAPEDRAARCLNDSAELLELLSRQIPEAEPAGKREADAVFDGAAEQVCRCCPQFRRCWRQNAPETYDALCSAARLVMPRGVARAEDFPQRFRDECLHFDGFLTAVDQELEAMLRRRRYRVKMEENRRILAEEYHDLASFLRKTQRGLENGETLRAQYTPELGISSRGKSGVSGDCAACFTGVRGECFVVLCDGMGTGAEAAGIGSESLNLLRRVLRAGMEPEAALRLLNGVYLLRENGCFATVDLLRVDLTNGSAVLYKWGAASSYRCCEDGICTLGTQTLPPGVGLGGENEPEILRISIADGAPLIMASDGLDSLLIEQTLEESAQLPPRELAALLVASASVQDDVTAIVLRLLPIRT